MSQPVFCFSILLTVSFPEQQFLILIKSNWSLLYCINWVMLSVSYLKILPNAKSQRYSRVSHSFHSCTLIYGLGQGPLLCIRISNCLTTISWKDCPFATEFPLWLSQSHLCTSTSAIAIALCDFYFTDSLVLITVASQ